MNKKTARNVNNKKLLRCTFLISRSLQFDSHEKKLSHKNLSLTPAAVQKTFYALLVVATTASEFSFHSSLNNL
jgi:hypothetical protein